MTEETILLAALNLASAAERAAYLDTACAGNPALRERVDALLRTHARAGPDGPGIVRPAEENTEPNRHTEFLAGDADDAADGSLVDEELLAFLAPSSEPGSLGRLDHYEVLELIGRGGMGVVFKADDTRLKRTVAIKILAPQLAAIGAARQRFFREARSAAAVRDEHVVSIHAVSDDSGPVPYLVMEFIAGVTLEERVRARGALLLKEILRIGMQAAAGLASAHKQGLIHRDIKPGNILLENGVERVKITDFGLARASDDASLSQSGVIAGTPQYMSPEQARGEPLDRRSDLFSLGSVLYTLCAGRPAFRADNTIAVLKLVCEDTPTPIRQVNPEIPEWLEAIVNKLMAKDPAERFQTADELKSLLRRKLAELQGPLAVLGAATSETWLPPAVVAPAPVPPTVSLSRIPWSRRRLAAGVLLLVVLVSAVAAGVAILGDRWRQPSPSGSAVASAIPAPPPRPDDPRVLTVSKRPSDKARFNTIAAALAAAEEGMTVRVLDDAVYEEALLVTARHRGVTLEAMENATILQPPSAGNAMRINGGQEFTLRGFRFRISDHHAEWSGSIICAQGSCSGLLLDRLDVATRPKVAGICLGGSAQGSRSAPIRIKNCKFHQRGTGVHVQGHPDEAPDEPIPCGFIVIQDNVMTHCAEGVALSGVVHHTLVAGNRILETEFGAIDFLDPLRGTLGVTIVNNTLYRNLNKGLQILDDHDKGEAFLECKQVRFQSNLILEHGDAVDQILLNRKRGVFFGNAAPGDLKSLLQSPEWQFGFNWHEAARPVPSSLNVGNAIPPVPDDHYKRVIKAGSRNPNDPSFLRPPKDSPLATGGAGAKPGPNDLPLPAYVGAVPPEGVEPWDWDKTWKAMVDDPRVLTVSKRLADKARFNTIAAALDAAEEGMTVRVIDDAVYDECLLVTARHRGFTLEGIANATLRCLPDKTDTLIIRDAPHVTVRGLRFTTSDRPDHKTGGDLIHIAGQCVGLLLDRLDMAGDKAGDGKPTPFIDLYSGTGTKDDPIRIQGCTFRECLFSEILVEGSARNDLDQPLPCGYLIIRDNVFTRCGAGITTRGATHHVLVAANRFHETRSGAVDVLAPLLGMADAFFVNNTMFRNSDRAFGVWQHRENQAFSLCKNIRFQYNLILQHAPQYDMYLLKYKPPDFTNTTPGDVESLLTSPGWHFGFNWHEASRPDPNSPDMGAIPPIPEEHYEPVINVLSWNPDDPNFLRPPKDSPLATAGAGAKPGPNDPPLPAYVGAVPPEGVEPWDWEKTWRAMVR